MNLELDDEIGNLAYRSDQTTFSVREINEAISLAISEAFPQDIWVKGEVQRLRFHTSGHIYFDLVDSGSKTSSVSTIPVTLLKWSASKIKADLREILVEDREIRILARPDFYAPYGKMSLAALDIDTAFTIGNIAIARRELIEKLNKEGVLKNNSELELDQLAINIALVTSIESAAYHDVVDQLRLSNYGFNIIAINALMQGSGSVDSVVAALEFANKLDVNAILLCRGGGAKSDLATFDNEKVVRMITGLSKPLLSGLGHQIDVSVSDLVANRALKTPTACAQFLVDRTQKAVDDAIELTEKISDSAIETIEIADLRLANLTSRLGEVNYYLERSSDYLNNLERILKTNIRSIIESAHLHRQHLNTLVEALDPMRVIERGFSVVYSSNGTILKSLKEVKSGEELRIRIVDGEIDAKVTGKRSDKTKE